MRNSIIRAITLTIIISFPFLSFGFQEEDGENDSSQVKKATKELPLEPGREISFNTSEGSWTSVDISPDGKTLVFDMLGDLYTMPVGGGKATPLTQGLQFDSHPRYSPDGKYISYISDRSGGENLWIIRLTDKKQIQLSKGSKNAMQSAEWTPDGDYIIVSKGTLGLQKLWMYHREGGGGIQVIKKPEALRTVEPAVSPDGRYIWYSQRRGSWNYNAQLPQYQIARYDRETGLSENMTDRYGSAFTPTLSPDGKWMAYGTRFEDKTGLVLRDLRTGDEKWLAYPVQRDEQESVASMDVLPGMTFTNDSQFLITTYGGTLHKIPISGGAALAIPMDVDVKLEMGPELDFDYPIEDSEEFVVRQIRDVVLSPDGSKLAFTALNKLYVMDYPNGEPKRITKSDDTEAYPAWSPDSKHIAYVTWNDEGGHVWRVNVTGRARPQQLTMKSALYQQTAWSFTNRITFIQASAQVYKDAYSPFSAGTMQEIAWISSEGGVVNVVERTQGRTNPHFVKGSDRIFMFHGSKGLISLRWDGTDEKAHVKVKGITTSRSKTPSNASLILMAPEGDKAIAQVNNDIYVVTVPKVGGDTPEITVASPENAQFPSMMITHLGGQFPSWGGKGSKAYFSLGNAFFAFDINEAKAYADSVKLAKENKTDNSDKDEEQEEAKEGDEQKKKDEGYQASEIRVKVMAPRDIPKGKIFLKGARIITMNGDEIFEKGDIFIVNNRIVDIGPSGSVRVDKGSKTLDVSGKTIIPGLVDTHAHMWPEWGIHKDQTWIYQANLAYGVTTTRDPQTATTDVLTYADQVRAGNMLGPRIYSTGPGVGYWANNIKSLDHARKVLKQYSEYYNTKTIKMYLVGNRQQRQWVIQAAHEQKLMPTTEGALDMKLDITQILDGYPGHEHSFPIYPLYNDVIQFVAKSGTTYTPTLLVSYGGPWAENYFYSRENPHDDPKLRRFTAHEELDQKSRRRPGWFRDEEHVFDDHGVFVKDLVEAGGYAGVGSHGQLQGLGYHWELWSMHAGGISEHDMLKVATIHGARAIGLENDLGTLEKGKLADLIILEKNPLDDIRNTNTIQWVMMNGRLFNGENLDQVLPEEVKAPTPNWWRSEPEGLPGVGGN